ncbi:dual specificity protein phosphatase 23-like [Euwallacea similis]|uniref:dual specificity protein phosphatase 23-like n=1 Tax=Euwallacea similis TaxID=1736056 RepID=UPI00344BE918
MIPNTCRSKHEAPWNFSWIVPGRLAGSSCPHTVANLQFNIEEGISHLITLSPEYKPPLIDFPGLTWHYLPIREFEAPTLEDMKKFIEICKICIEKKEAIAIHCRAGRGRTGTMAAVYLVHFHNMSPDSAISKLRMMRPGSVETYEQEKAVATYRDYLRSTAN